MKNYFKIIFGLAIFMCLFVSPVLVFGIEYQSLAPIDSYVHKKITIDDKSLTPYLNNMFKLGIALCTALAVLMIIIGGIQYVSSDAWSNKSEGKERMFAALTGLLIALGSWVLLTTISPRLVSTELSLEEVDMKGIETADTQEGTRYLETGTVPDTTDPALNSGNTGLSPSGNMSPIPEGIKIKGGTGTTVDQSMVTGLQGMNNELKEAGIDWRITEGFPPPRDIHKNPCHKNNTPTSGNCVDANFTGATQATDANVKKFIQTANNNGFRAVWEVNSVAEENRLKAAGIPASNVKYIGHSTAPHFSVYNKSIFK